MMSSLGAWLRGRRRVPAVEGQVLPDDIAAIVSQVRPYTMTSPARLWALIDAVRYIVKRDLPGAFAECGVWRGGSVMAMILALAERQAPARDIVLFDTFEGMTAPTKHDRSEYSEPALDTWRRAEGAGQRPWRTAFEPAWIGEDAVRANLLATGYPADRLHFIKGPVEATLPAHAPESLALLRLDTDWYDSTRHELEHLYPRLQPGGVLIIDDYGHWQGCRRAVDEYFGRADVTPVLLQRIDYTARLAIKA